MYTHNLTVKDPPNVTLSLKTSLGSTTVLGGGYSPYNLFVSGEVGVWFDPSDLTTMFQDNLGTIPVTAPGQPVGLILDKSKGLQIGPELVTNGSFTSDTSWTKGSGWTISGGSANKSAGSATSLYQPVAISEGKTYRISFTATRSAGFFTPAFTNLGVIDAFGVAITASGTYVQYILAPAGATHLIFYADAAFSGSLDNVSVKEVQGNHASQSTSSSRPIYGVVPRGGRRNLLSYSEQIDNAVWTKPGSTITSNAALAPDGGFTADQINNPGNVVQTQSVNFGSGLVGITFSVWLRSVTGTNQSLTISVAGAGATTVTVTPVWQRFSTVFNNPPSGTLVGRIGAATQSYNVYAWGAQLEVGNVTTPYQRVVSSYDVTEVGVDTLHYLDFDGVDDFLVTPSITPNVDKVQVYTGVRKLSDSGYIVESSVDASSNSGTFRAYAITGGYNFQSRGTVNASPASVSSGFSSPVTSVISGLGDIVADVATLRINGGQLSQSTVDQGTGNYLAYPLYIGRRGNATLPFRGLMFSLLVRFGANLSTNLTASTESWVNQKTGAY